MAKYDFMSFGEPNIRMTPHGYDRLGQTDELQLGIAATELNCCVNISNLSVQNLLPQMKTAYITKLVDNWTGRYIVNRASMYGVDMSNIVVEPYDNIGRTRNGLAFVEVGIGPRPSYQLYDRGHTALSKLQPGEIDWSKVLDTRWFHTTGIVMALGEHTASEVLTAIRTAKENGATVSFDFNYRSTLWSKEKAGAAIRPLMPYVDVIFAGPADITEILGLPVDGLDAARSATEQFEMASRCAMEHYPNLQTVATSLRWVHSALLNDWQGCMMTRQGCYFSHKYDKMEINDRVGGGDSFASAIIWGMLSHMPERECLEFAAAYSALCHTIRNDWCLASKEEAQALANGAGASVRR